MWERSTFVPETILKFFSVWNFCWVCNRKSPKPFVEDGNISYLHVSLFEDLLFPGHTSLDGRVKVSLDGKLTIKDVRPADEGNYVCAAMNAAGSSLTKAALKVDSKSWLFLYISSYLFFHIYMASFDEWSPIHPTSWGPCVVFVYVGVLPKFALVFCDR